MGTKHTQEEDPYEDIDSSSTSSVKAFAVCLKAMEMTDRGSTPRQEKSIYQEQVLPSIS